MSEEEPPAGESPDPAPRPADADRQDERKPKDRGEPADGGRRESDRATGDDPEQDARDRAERERVESRFAAVGSDPREEGEDTPVDAAATAEAHRSARASFDIRRDQHNFHRPEFQNAHFGDVNLRLDAQRTAVFSGPVPEDELLRLRRVYQQPDGFEELAQSLRSRRLLVLGGARGGGRTCTALVLLDRMTDPDQAGSPAPPRPRVSRLDPRTAPAELTGTELEEHGRGHGFLMEIPESNDTALMPAEVHLDALAAALGACDSYAVVVVASGAATTTMLSGRYGRLCPDAPADRLLESRLRERLEDRPEGRWEDLPEGPPGAAGGLSEAVALARDPEVAAAVGLDELRPREVERLADLLAEHALGTLPRDGLLARCRELADHQAHEWFAGLDREIGGESSPGVPSAATLMYPAAFRVALSVFHGSTHSIVAEAANALAWEMAVAREPERSPARALFCDDESVTLGLSRAALGEGHVLVADVPVPVRTVRFRGTALPTAVLGEVWTRHHAARPPVVRWLRSLADDPRPQVRVRAAVAAGELCVRDFEYGYEQLLRPMATAAGARRRMFAATALDQVVRHDSHRSAIRALIRAWARSDSSSLRWTAAVALGYGHCTARVGSALDLLARIGLRNDGEHLAVASHSTVLLAAGSDDMAVLRRIGQWVQGRRRDRQDQDLGLLSVARLAATRVGEIWDGEASPDLADYQKWPLALALATAREGRTVPVADLLWHALQVLRSRATVTASLEVWLRRACSEEGEALFTGLERLLPLLVDDDEDRERLRWLINRMVEDEDDPLPAGQARRIWRAVESRPLTNTHREKERV
ncbi:hypothetical protein [Kitasatospora sp. NPDC088346]|uniref:hypothetical protein n=1 Tax=Kitasatospora sp. NPDC088346 TaxID=3364073 RepID=UPI0038184E3A